MEHAFSRFKNFAAAYLIKIEKRFEKLPIITDFAKLEIEKIKSLKDSDIEEWGNDSIKRLTQHFMLLNFGVNADQEKIFDEKVMLEQYKLYKLYGFFLEYSLFLEILCIFIGI